MLIAKKDYVALVDGKARAETRADWFLTRVNALERELGDAKYQVTGRAVAVPIIHREHTPRPVDDPAETSFDDVGDENALKLGL